MKNCAFSKEISNAEYFSMHFFDSFHGSCKFLWLLEFQHLQREIMKITTPDQNFITLLDIQALVGTDQAYIYDSCELRGIP